MPARYLLVNVPDFRLEAIENGKPVMDMRVVVGRAGQQDADLRGRDDARRLQPVTGTCRRRSRRTKPFRWQRAIPDSSTATTWRSWTARPGARCRNDVDWSKAEGLRIRQQPGAGNALGGVKFIFPNTFDVYLHDTNAGALFNRLERGLSHGCVRVEQPLALAQYVLRDQNEWTAETIQQAMQSGEEKHVKLKAAAGLHRLQDGLGARRRRPVPERSVRTRRRVSRRNCGRGRCCSTGSPLARSSRLLLLSAVRAEEVCCPPSRSASVDASFPTRKAPSSRCRARRFRSP